MAFSQFQKCEIRGPGSQVRVRALLLDCRGLPSHCLLTWLRGEGGERNRGREIEKERERERFLIAFELLDPAMPDVLTMTFPIM